MASAPRAALCLDPRPPQSVFDTKKSEFAGNDERENEVLRSAVYRLDFGRHCAAQLPPVLGMPRGARVRQWPASFVATELTVSRGAGESAWRVRYAPREPRRSNACARGDVPFEDEGRVAVPTATALGETRWRVARCAYFELRITSAAAARTTASLFDPAPPCVAIGFCEAAFSGRDRMPGWDAQSVGFHSDDGKAFHDGGRGQDLTTPCRVGDVMGAGVCRRGELQLAFFTRNGTWLGATTHRAVGPLYPVVGLDDATVGADVNLGFSEPFLFDVFDDAGLERRLQAATAFRFLIDAALEDDRH